MRTHTNRTSDHGEGRNRTSEVPDRLVLIHSRNYIPFTPRLHKRINFSKTTPTSIPLRLGIAKETQPDFLESLTRQPVNHIVDGIIPFDPKSP